MGNVVQLFKEPIESIQELTLVLEKFNFLYYTSSDPNVFRRGKAQEERILRAAELLQCRDLVTQYSEWAHGIVTANKPDEDPK